MTYSNLEISGACLIKCHHHEDSRGTFGRLFDAHEIQMATGVSKFKQVSYSTNVKKGTIRGLHFQATPSQECKLISVVAGAVFDVLVDLRPDSKSFGKSLTLELSVGQECLFIPQGVAHGFQTLRDDTILIYSMDVPYSPELSRGVRYDDPELNILWPLPVSTISQRDLELPSFVDVVSTISF